MRYIKGEDRHQIRLLSFDSMIPEKHIVRVVDIFVDLLDLTDYDIKYNIPKAIGRKAYPPKIMMKLYLYGYTQKVRSSRKLEKATHENLPFIWLMHELKPDFKTISNFRKDNKGSFIKVFRAFNKYCYTLKIIDLELVAIDGTYIDAVNHNSKNYTKKKLNELLNRIDSRIESYFNTMDNQDSISQDSELTLEELKAKKDYYQTLIEKANETGSSQISITDPDSRMMRKGGSKADVSYNAQIAVDNKNKIIVDQDVCNECNDSHQLAAMSKLIKASYGVKKLSVVADKGYGNGKEIQNCNANGIETFVPIQSNEYKAGTAFGTYKFLYNRKEDNYTCPNNRVLPFRCHNRSKSADEYGSRKTCLECEFKNDCIGGISKRFRSISRSIYRDTIELQEEINKDNKDIISKRKTIVEHPFGTIKRTMNQSYFLTKGLEMVKGEFSITCLAYNIKRVMNILGFDRIIASMKSFFDKERKKMSLFFVYFYIFIGNLINISKSDSKLAIYSH